uniref:Uncharacterized protein n=1 Tax=Mesocestoides corti TaxID=53468 RepID=A0A5K3F6I2_MESCO
HSCPSLIGCLSSSHATGTQRDTGLAEASLVQYVCPLRRRYTWTGGKQCIFIRVARIGLDGRYLELVLARVATNGSV